ncbi:hypothetical protein D1Z97_05175 [Riemerella anatipestifer]|uniref:hypothetical protein n=1 Tax=Riemerella anatipestifer TaxID=34085 RepID=UPI00129EB89E|nr:hypothetical protein [Riemerella anatipestifer]MRM96641.1 hypothetical protein [Riemerella anatipestifer]MRN00587.1 hypothetical protein [Riemerella anatipestifer]MRN02755.1 hypothetical protein [Riemerella anatipestifer]
MKKLFLVGALALFGAVNAQSNGHFKLGANVSLPVGDLGKSSSIGIGADLGYMFKVAKGFELGAVTGYTHFFGKEYKTAFGTVKANGLGYIPLAAAAKYNVTPEFFLGTDLGVAFSTVKNSGTAFYYNPRVGYQFSNNEIALSYKGFSRDGGNSGAVSLGYFYNF